MVADIEDFKGMNTSELHARRLNAKELLTPQRSGNFIFPVADGTLKNFGRDQRLRTSTLTRERPERGEEHSPIQLHDDSTRDDEEAKNDFWTITGEFIHRHHVEPRVKLYMPKEESFPIPLKYIDVTRTTDTSPDVMLEKQIEDYWNVDGEKDLSDAWTGFTKGHPMGADGLGGDLQGNKKLLVPTMYGHICGNLCPMQQKGQHSKDGLSRNQSSIMPDDFVVSSSLNQTMKNSSSH